MSNPNSNAASKEVERLSKWILDNFPNEPGSKGHGESAVDVAVRLLDEHKRLRDSIYEIYGIPFKGGRADEKQIELGLSIGGSTVGTYRHSVGTCTVTDCPICADVPCNPDVDIPR